MKDTIFKGNVVFKNSVPKMHTINNPTYARYIHHSTKVRILHIIMPDDVHTIF